MSKTAPDLTPNGWPLLTADHYIDAVPVYTMELADKLDNSEADVAAAINAAQDAQAAAAAASDSVQDAQDVVDAVPRMESGFAVLEVAGTSTSIVVPFTPGRFTVEPGPYIQVTKYGTSGREHRYDIKAASRSTSEFTIWAVPYETSGAPTGSLVVHWLAVA